ncbi:MAG: hypothetical protein NC318_09755 [Blautia sp.]|nr:hypothetical protein [Lachnoclostridium sp.]MCM1211875.1 hypothetical protein [Blautia sp.]
MAYKEIHVRESQNRKRIVLLGMAAVFALILSGCTCKTEAERKETYQEASVDVLSHNPAYSQDSESGQE